MATTQRSDLFIPEVIAEGDKGFSGKLVLTGSGAIVVNPRWAWRWQVGNTVTVPYIGDGGEAQVITGAPLGASKDDHVDGDRHRRAALQGLLGHAPRAVAKATGRDINEVAADMVASGCARALGIGGHPARPVARHVGLDGYDGTAGNISRTRSSGRWLFGEELDDSQLAVWAKDAKPYWDAAKDLGQHGPRALHRA